MNSLQEISTKIIAFRDCDKFKTYQHLQPAVSNSTPETISLVNSLFNKTSGEILDSLNSGDFKEQELMNILLETIKACEQMELDTEDFEFCYELIDILSSILNIDITKEVKQKEAQSLDEFKKLIEMGGFNPKDFGL